MDFVNPYGKTNGADQQQLSSCRKTRKRLLIVTLSAVVLACIVVAAVVGTHNKNDDEKKNDDKPLSMSVKTVCNVTLYQDACYASLAPKFENSSNIKPADLIKYSIQVALYELEKVANEYSLKTDATADPMTAQAFENCKELLDLAIDHVNSSLALSGHNVFDDLKTWLSSAITFHDTCLEGFENATTPGDLSLRNDISSYLKNSTEYTSNSLAIVSWLSKIASSFKLRRLMSDDSGMPEWLGSKDRKLLQTPNLKATANFVVAKDGSGKFKTIKDALKAVPDKSDKRFVIYVKKGIYNENVRVEKTKWNVLIIGDGLEETIISGSLNVVDGTPTFSTATLAALGKGFIAQDLWIRNTAGAVKHQAVALMSGSDQSVFYKCKFDAFQDTLYPHSNRQFYRDCTILGTVDFIFGNSAVVFQNCNILPRKPMQGQQNTITAQGKVDPNQNTGIVIQNCNISPFENLGTVRTYLGRPWKDYSTTIFMQSFLGSLIDPSGWLPWVGNSAPNTIFYAEYMNTGTGSSTKNRVKWKGLRAITSVQASKFTVKSFLLGDKWIAAARVPFKSGL